MVIAYLFGLVFGLGHLLSEKICRKVSENREFLISFIAGMSIAYLFLELFPLVFQEGKMISEMVFLFMMVGFLVFFIFEKYIYKHSRTRLVVKEITILHSAGFFIYHFIIGMVITGLLDIGLEKALLFFIPTFLYSLVGEVSLNEIYYKVKEKWFSRLLLALSSLLGVAVAKNFFISNAFNSLLLGFLAGAFTYLITRDSVPRDKEGNLLAIAFGVVLYTFLIFLLWIL